MLTRRGAALAAVVATAVAAAAGAPGAAEAAPLRTGIVDPGYIGSTDTATRERSFERTRATGATVVRLMLFWGSVAPSSRPPGFDPRNPAEPSYNWGWFDAQVIAARAKGLDPLVTVMNAPPWATSDGSAIRQPNATAFGQFAEAAARRYSGSFRPTPSAAPLPRVRYWMAWNEPNRDYFLMPQIVNGKMVSATHYRALVRAFSAGVKRVHSTNAVIAGGLAPLGRPGKPAPLAFMRNLLCVSRTLKRTCNLRTNPLRFDVWSHHPYTSGGPTHEAKARDDVALGDLPEMKRLVRAAVRLGQVRPRSGLGFWVTEFSWDSKPPDPRALGASLHARWTSEALYRMWKLGVGVVTWFKIEDEPLSTSPYQSGFFMTNGARKRSFTAFRFPVVALKQRTGVYVWGRTPTSRAGTVVVELRAGNRWRRLGTVRAAGGGIFKKTFRTPYRKGSVRARFAGETSLPFGLAYVKDRYVNPFGCGGGIRC